MECDKIFVMAHSIGEARALGGEVSASLGRGASCPGLTNEQRTLLTSIVSVLTPGSAVCGACLDSMDRRLAGPLSRMLPAIQQGLDAMDSACLQKTGLSLIELDMAERGKFVRELRSGHKLTAFFGLITSSCAISS